MTLEEVLKNLRQDTKTKATMEEVDKSYKLFKKIENLIVADLEAKLAESEKTEDGAFWFEKWQHKKRDYDSVYKAYIENCAEVDQLKQQLAETDKLMQEYLSKCLSLEQQLAEKEKEVEYQESMKILAVKNQNQTAIAELEKAKDFMLGALNVEECIEYADQQINNLRSK